MEKVATWQFHIPSPGTWPGHLLERCSDGLQLDRQQLEPHEPARLDRVHRLAVSQVEDQCLGDEHLGQRDLVAFRGGEAAIRRLEFDA